MSKSARKHKWLFIIGIPLLILLLLVVLLPTFVTWGLGQGYIRQRVNQNINGTVQWDRLHVRWFGQQQVRGLQVIDPQGQQAANLDVTINTGLLPLLLSSATPIEATVSGQATGVVREDGTVSFQDLIPRDAARSQQPQSQTPAQPQPLRLPELPPLQIHFAKLALHLTSAATGQTLALDDLTGQFTYQDFAQPITLSLQGATMTEGVPGSIDVQAEAADLFDANGALQVSGASARLGVRAQSIPLPLLQEPAHVRTMTLNFASDDLTHRIVLDVEGQVQIADHEPSELRMYAWANQLITSQGELSPQGAAASVDLTIENAPFSSPDISGVVQQLVVTLMSDDLTQQVRVAMHGEAQLAEYQPSVLAANLDIEQLFAPDGQIQFALERITGAVRSERVPSPLLDPVLRQATPVVASRDFGPVMDIDATFSAGTQRDVSIVAVGPQARLEMRGVIDPDDLSVRGSHLLITTPAAHPELIRGYTSLAVTQPTDLTIQLNSFLLPPVDPALGARPLPLYAAQGTVQANGPIVINVPRGEAAGIDGDAESGIDSAAVLPLTVRDVNVRIDSPQLQQHITIAGSANVDGANVAWEETVTNLFDEQGQLALARAMPIGTLTVEQLPASTVARLVPQQAHVIDAALGNSANLTLTTSAEEAGLHAELQATSERINSNISALRRTDALYVDGGHVSFILTPELAQLLQRDRENPIVLEAPATASIDIQPFELPAAGPGFQYELSRTQPILASVAVTELALGQVPSLVEPLGFRQLIAEAQLMVEGSALALNVTGDVGIFRPRTNSLLGYARYRLRSQFRDGEMTSPELDLGIVQIAMSQLESMLGAQAGAYSQWTGEGGSFQALISEDAGIYHAEIQTAMPRMEGNVLVSTAPESISLASGAIVLKMDRQVLEQRMNPQQANDAAQQQQQQHVRVAADMPLTIIIDRVNLPLAMFRNQAFDPATALIDASLAGGPLILTHEGGVQTTIRDLHGTLASSNLARGIEFTLAGEAAVQAPEGAQQQQQQRPAGATPPPGAISRPAPSAPAAPRESDSGMLDIQGQIANLITDAGIFDPAQAQLTMTASAKHMPTALADALANMQGMLIAAVGPQMSGTFTANAFSSQGGSLDVRIDAPNGWLEATLQGGENALQIPEDKSLRGELAITPPLRERLLYRLHPILADVRTTAQPLRFSASNVVLPLDGDVSRLRSDIRMTVGEVAFDPGSVMLLMLRMAKRADDQPIRGEIEPIVATIRNGIVQYERFVVHIDKYDLAYSGQVNLVNGTVNLRTEIPLEGLAHTFQELQGFADQIVVPLVTQGEFGSLTTQIDPNFDIARAAAEAGFRGTLRELLDGRDPGKLLEDLLRQRDRDRNRNP